MTTLCAKCQELLEVQWDGESLSATEASFVANHLDACAQCRAQREAMGHMLACAADLREQQHLREVTLAPMVLQPRRPAWAGFVAGLASAAAVLAIGLHLGGRSSHRQGPEPESTAQMLHVRLVVPLQAAESVAVVGDFTGWKEGIALQRTADGLWVGDLRVPAGRYRYVLVVDGEHMQPDPAATQVVDDGFGGKNSVLDVGI